MRCQALHRLDEMKYVDAEEAQFMMPARAERPVAATLKAEGGRGEENGIKPWENYVFV